MRRRRLPPLRPRADPTPDLPQYHRGPERPARSLRCGASHGKPEEADARPNQHRQRGSNRQQAEPCSGSLCARCCGCGRRRRRGGCLSGGGGRHRCRSCSGWGRWRLLRSLGHFRLARRLRLGSLGGKPWLVGIACEVLARVVEAPGPKLRPLDQPAWGRVLWRGCGRLGRRCLQQVDGEDEEFAHGANATMITRLRKTAQHRRIPSYC